MLSPSRRLLVVAAVGAVALAILAWAVVAVVERYYDDNRDLRELAVALLPANAEVVLEHSSECSRSGWERLFTFRDTCHEVRFSLGTHAAGDAAQQAALIGWTVAAERPNGALDLVRPGYRAYFRLRASEEIETCVDSGPEEPGFCYHSVSVIEGD